MLTTKGDEQVLLIIVVDCLQWTYLSAKNNEVA